MKSDELLTTRRFFALLRENPSVKHEQIVIIYSSLLGILDFVSHYESFYTGRVKVSLVVFIIFSTLILYSCGGADQSASATSSTQPTSAQATQVPTKVPAPNLARLGGSVHDFALKFGKEDTSNEGIDYQPFGSLTSGQDLPTDKFDIAVDNRHVEGVTVTLPKENPLIWQEGTKLCQSFLPTDAVYQSAEDFSPQTQEYQQIYISKMMAHMFSADHFVAGSGINPQPLTPGIVQIMYYYSNWYDHTSSGAQITNCSIGLGEKL
jgi:hypothetical protein